MRCSRQSRCSGGAFLTYAQAKVASVRKLTRTSVTIPTINGNFKKKPQWILGGFLALEPRNATWMRRRWRSG